MEKERKERKRERKDLLVNEVHSTPSPENSNIFNLTHSL